MSDPQTTEAERRKHVEAAIAGGRIEGYPPPGPAEREILDAYVSGMIPASDLIDAYKRASGAAVINHHR